MASEQYTKCLNGNGDKVMVGHEGGILLFLSPLCSAHFSQQRIEGVVAIGSYGFSLGLLKSLTKYHNWKNGGGSS